MAEAGHITPKSPAPPRLSAPLAEAARHLADCVRRMRSARAEAVRVNRDPEVTLVQREQAHRNDSDRTALYHRALADFHAVAQDESS